MAIARPNTTAAVLFHLDGKVAPASKEEYKQAIVQATNKIVAEGNLSCDFMKLHIAFCESYITFSQKLKELTKQVEEKSSINFSTIKECSAAYNTAKKLVTDMDKALLAIIPSSADHTKFTTALAKCKIDFKDMANHNMDIGMKIKAQLESAAKMKAAGQAKSSPQINTQQTSAVITTAPTTRRF